jgi:hypothetical protein
MRSKRSRNNQQYSLICTTPLFFILAPTCFGSSLPSSGSFLDRSQLLEIQIEQVVNHLMCGYVACKHTGHVTTHMTYHLLDLYFMYLRPTPDGP